MKGLICLLVLFGLNTIDLKAQDVVHLSRVYPDEEVTIEEEISKVIVEDNRSTASVIWIKKESAKQYHLKHAQHLYVYKGKGEVYFPNDTLKIVEGDYIYIPQNTTFKIVVTRRKSLKLLSIIAPKFKGQDVIIKVE